MNKISIITVIKNGIPFLKDSINSFLLQKYPNKELIIILAKSDDGTGDFIKRNFGNYKEIKVFNEKKDAKNKFGALNQGLKLCRGEIIGILHSDDIYYSEHVLNKVCKVFSFEILMISTNLALFKCKSFVLFRTFEVT